MTFMILRIFWHFKKIILATVYLQNKLGWNEVLKALLQYLKSSLAYSKIVYSKMCKLCIQIFTFLTYTVTFDNNHAIGQKKSISR